MGREREECLRAVNIEPAVPKYHMSELLGKVLHR